MPLPALFAAPTDDPPALMPAEAALWPADLPPLRGQPLDEHALAQLSTCSEGRWQQDAQGLLIWACPGMLQLCGTTTSAWVGSHLGEWFGSDAAAALGTAVGTQLITTRASRKVGDAERWYQLTSTPWRNAQGQRQASRGVARDITAEVELAQRLQRSERSLLALIDTASEGIAVVQDEVFRYLNRHLEKFLGIPADQLVGRPFLDVIHPDDRPTLIANHHRRLAGESVPSRYEFRLHTQVRGVRWLELAGSVVDWEGRPATLAHITDITARKALEDQVRQFAFQDSLTGLANRRLLEERLAQTLEDGRRSGHHGALLYLDLDAFMPLNDTHGHAAGDLMLVSVAQRLRQSVRTTDVVARLGGDEFVVLLASLPTDAEHAAAAAERVTAKLREVLDAPHELTPPGATTAVVHRCTASIGMAMFGPTDADPQAVMQRADQAMYDVKAAKRSRTVHRV